MSTGDCRPSVALVTLGCKVNQYDSEALAEALRSAGWRVYLGLGADTADPDVVIVNSCAVTARAEAKSRQAARKAAKEHPRSRVVLAGCYPQIAPDAAGGVKGIAAVAGTARHDTVKLVETLLAGQLAGTSDRQPLVEEAVKARSLPADFELLPVAARPGRVRALLKVQDGCSNGCAYCVVPLARGPERSRPLDDAIAQARALVAGGARELVLTGIRLGAYDSGALVELAASCLELPGLARLRLSSIEPTDIPHGLLELMASDGRVCPHLHIPLQSGSDTVLGRMSRRYDAARYQDLVEYARRMVPGLAVTTDIMVGFPGETEMEFEETVAFVRRMRFSRLHVFPYSRRPGTAAARLPGHIPARVRAGRARVMTEVGRELSLAFHQGLVGSAEEVLVEREPELLLGGDVDGGGQGGGGLDGGGQGGGDAPYIAEGLTGRYVRVRATSRKPAPLGCLVAVWLTEARDTHMRGLVLEGGRGGVAGWTAPALAHRLSCPAARSGRPGGDAGVIGSE